jgi:hypothetical protein
MKVSAVQLAVLLLFSLIASGELVAQQSQSITLPLSPTALNVFNFGPHSFKVRYPAGTAFSGIDMTVTAVQLNQSAFKQRVAGTQFSNSSCVVYSGEGGFCIDYQVTCATTAHMPATCPHTTSSYISVLSSFDTTQLITNPGLLTAPIGADSWQNILDQFFLTRRDPTAHGHTKGFSQFVVVSLGVTDPNGSGTLIFNAPLRSSDPRSFPVGMNIPVSFNLVSSGHPVPGAIASISVLMVADGAGHPASEVVFYRQNAFTFTGKSYDFTLSAAYLPAGTYSLTVYGDAFASQDVSFTVK